jgi:TolB-like protein/tetratricopeptide (TPR) repeat protein
MSLIAELKRRNVFRVGAAYGIVAWVLIEVAHTAFPTLQLPDWTTTMVTVLLIMGFPVALVIAWAFELTPEGIKRETAVDSADSIRHVTGRRLDFIIIGLLALAVVYLVVDKLALTSEPGQAEVTAEQIFAAKRAVREKSIAVLPFVNMSSDPEQEYFSDGLSEEILNLLAKIPGLKVIGRTSSFAFKGKNEDLRTIGEALDVSTVLEGSVRKSGDRVRITAQLIDVSNGAHLWSESYDRTITDIFAVQDDVASAIITALQIHVGTAPTRGRPTENSDAYALFLKGRDAINHFDAPSASQFLLEAVELDPKFAEAYELLAYTYWYQAGETMDAVEAQARVRDAAARAVAIDPNLVFARVLLIESEIETYSLAEFEATEPAVKEGSNQWVAAEILTWNLMQSGYFREALGVVERFVESDPLSPAVQSRLADALQAVGRRDEALSPLKLADQFGSEIAKRELFHFYLEDERDELAITHLEARLKEDEGGLPTGWVRDLIVGARDPATGQAHLDRRIPQIVASMPEDHSYEMRGILVRLYLTLGFLDRYYELLDELSGTSSGWSDSEIFVYAGTIKRPSGFTAHPRYLKTAEKYAYGVVSLWDQRGAPDHCEKVSGQWICE